MTKARWYRGFDNSPDGGLAKKAEGEATRRFNQDYRERAYRERNPLPPVERDRRPPVPYKADPRNHRDPPSRPRPLGPNDYGDGPVIDNDTGKRVPPPKNPYRRPPAMRGGLPVTPRRWPRPRFPGLPWLDVLDIVDPLLFPDRSYRRPPILPSNYSWCTGPVDWPAGYKWTEKPFFVWFGGCAITPWLGGQVGESSQHDIDNGEFIVIRYGTERSYLWRNYEVPAPINSRGSTNGSVVKTGPPPGGIQRSPYWPVISMAPPPDPNMMRHMPPVPDYDPRGREGTRPADPFAPVYAPTPDSPYEPDGSWQFEPALGGGSAPGTGFSGETVTGEVPFVPIPPVTRAPPTHGERQRKLLSKSAKVGIALYKALDAASESAEIVDAVWKALPDDVRKRWKQCKQGYQGDNFGQYGIEQAHCKMRAIYWNLDKLDVEKAIKEIIKNGLSDAVIGGMQGGLPKNTGNALASGEKELAKWLDKYLSEELGL